MFDLKKNSDGGNKISDVSTNLTKQGLSKSPYMNKLNIVGLHSDANYSMKNYVSHFNKKHSSTSGGSIIVGGRNNLPMISPNHTVYKFDATASKLMVQN